MLESSMLEELILEVHAVGQTNR